MPRTLVHRADPRAVYHQAPPTRRPVQLLRFCIGVARTTMYPRCILLLLRMGCTGTHQLGWYLWCPMLIS